LSFLGFGALKFDIYSLLIASWLYFLVYAALPVEDFNHQPDMTGLFL
jgi:hypothetical protein